MAYYLAMHEAPCVSVAPEAFEADDDRQAEDIAFEQSLNSNYYVTGGYDLYRIVWNAFEHKYELSMVVPDDALTDVPQS